MHAPDGDEDAQERFTATLYGELRSLAGRYFNPAHADALVLQPTAIVHEALLRLLGRQEVDPKSRTHFLASAAVAMRCVVVDHARARRTQKRGGDVTHVTIDTRDAVVSDSFVDVIVLNDLFDRLSRLSPRAARVVEMRVFGGMTAPEIAEVLDVSKQTIKGDWRTARAWLRVRLKEGSGHDA